MGLVIFTIYLLCGVCVTNGVIMFVPFAYLNNEVVLQKFLIMNQNSGQIYESADGFSWTLTTTGFGNNLVYSLTMFNSYVYKSNLNNVTRSNDYINYPVVLNARIQNLRTFGNILMGGQTTAPIGMRTSTDGVTWPNNSLPVGQIDVCYRPSPLIYVGSNGFSSSGNATTWVSNGMNANSSGGGIWQSIDYGAGRFVAISNDGYTMTSTTGTGGWTETFITTKGFRKIRFLNNRFIAISIADEIWTSPDGINWTLRVPIPGGNAAVYDIAYGNGVYVLTMQDNVRYSTDTITWINSTPGIGNWTAVTFGK